MILMLAWWLRVTEEEVSWISVDWKTAAVGTATFQIFVDICYCTILYVRVIV